MEIDAKQKDLVYSFIEESFNVLKSRDEVSLHKCYNKGMDLFNDLPDSEYKEKVAFQLCQITELARQEEKLRELIPYLDKSSKESVLHYAFLLKIYSFRRTREREKEFEAINEFVDFSISLSNDGYVSESLLMLGDFYFHDNQNDEAFKLYCKSVYHSQCCHNKSLEGKGRIRLGLIWMKDERLGLALDEFLEAEQLSTDSYDQILAFKSVILRAYCNLALCRHKNAKSILEDAVNLIRVC